METVYGYKYQTDQQHLGTDKSADAYATSSPGTVINN
jgi:hypothetical protein